MLRHPPSGAMLPRCLGTHPRACASSHPIGILRRNLQRCLRRRPSCRPPFSLACEFAGDQTRFVRVQAHRSIHAISDPWLACEHRLNSMPAHEHERYWRMQAWWSCFWGTHGGVPEEASLSFGDDLAKFQLGRPKIKLGKQHSQAPRHSRAETDAMTGDPGVHDGLLDDSEETGSDEEETEQQEASTKPAKRSAWSAEVRWSECSHIICFVSASMQNLRCVLDFSLHACGLVLLRTKCRGSCHHRRTQHSKQS